MNDVGAMDGSFLFIHSNKRKDNNLRHKKEVDQSKCIRKERMQSRSSQIMMISVVYQGNNSNKKMVLMKC